MPDVGGRPSEIRATEQRLGRKLPPSIREYVAYAHDVFPEPGSRFVHRDPYTMRRLTDQPVPSLMMIGHQFIASLDFGILNGYILLIPLSYPEVPPWN